MNSPSLKMRIKISVNILAVGGVFIVGGITGYGVAAHLLMKKLKSVLREQHSTPELVEVLVVSNAPTTVGRIKNVPQEAIQQMKQMREEGATFKDILETVGKEYGLKYENEVSRAIKSQDN